MKSKLLNLLLIITSLLGYLEWGKDNATFLFEAELDIVKKLISNPQSALHPFTIIPLVAQLLLIITLFQKKPGAIITYIGLSGLTLLLGFMFLIGLMSWNVKILLSTVPFLVVAILTVIDRKKSQLN
ncbi:MAG: hypothetical protein ACK4IZ_10550 [Flavobacterium sp.]|uniref:hypothetical protein n=1 Tax=Flavobacterium TaxID=237 RepID=UPI0039198B86